jgi:hypothetical protein
MTKKKKVKQLSAVTIHRRLKIKQYEPPLKPVVNSGAPDG